MLQNLQNFAKFQKFQLDNLVDFEKCCKTHILILAKIGAGTAENEQYFAEILPKTGNYPTTLRSAGRVRSRRRGTRRCRGGPSSMANVS